MIAYLGRNCWSAPSIAAMVPSNSRRSRWLVMSLTSCLRTWSRLPKQLTGLWCSVSGMNLLQALHQRVLSLRRSLPSTTRYWFFGPASSNYLFIILIDLWVAFDDYHVGVTRCFKGSLIFISREKNLWKTVKIKHKRYFGVSDLLLCLLEQPLCWLSEYWSFLIWTSAFIEIPNSQN